MSTFDAAPDPHATKPHMKLHLLSTQSPKPIYMDIKAFCFLQYAILWAWNNFNKHFSFALLTRLILFMHTRVEKEDLFWLS